MENGVPHISGTYYMLFVFNTVEVEDVFRVSVDLFLAGSEATSTVLHWFFLYIVMFPDVQKQCFKEITQVRRIEMVTEYPISYPVS